MKLQVLSKRRGSLLLAAFLFCFSLLIFTDAAADFAEANERGMSMEEMKSTKVIIETTFGDIELKLLPEVAPGHVENFVRLAKDGFYDGTLFHRVIPGFMIQGGDPNTKGKMKSTYGQGGPGWNIDAEFSSTPHKRGILSMARSQSPNSAGSQFFIVVKDSNFLDNQYTVFGEVVNGMDVADQIVNQPRDSRDLPNDRIEMKMKVIED